MKKDDMLEITIEDISSDGSGVGKADGFALFVKDTIPGDQVKVKIMKMKKRYGYARLMEILVPSPDRIQAPCPVARQCGGCQIQQMSYERQLTFKENKVCNNLRRLGGLDLSAMEVEPICGMEEPFHYRNKAQFPIGRDKNGKIIAGFYAGRTHSIIANTDCLLGAEENEAILNEVISWMEVCKVEPYDEKTGKGLVRHVLIRKGFTTKELMVCLVINGRKIPQVEKLVDRLQKIEGSYDFIFMDAAKGQYIHFLPDVMRLLKVGGILISDNVLQDGDIIESHYAVERRNRTIYKRMREYLYELKHNEHLVTSIVPIGDGATLSVKIKE